jgi:hypothetical protein
MDRPARQGLWATHAVDSGRPKHCRKFSGNPLKAATGYYVGENAESIDMLK